MADSSSEPTNNETERALPPRSGLATFFRSPAVKMVLIGFISILLIIPCTFVWVLVEERADRAREVSNDIAGSWGESQTINGPYLVVPFTETKLITRKDKKDDTYKQERAVWHRKAILFPERLDLTGDVRVEERKKSIYTLPVYRSELSFSGRFGKAPDGMFEPKNGGRIEVAADKAVLVIGIRDVRALKSEVILESGDRKLRFQPGLAGIRNPDPFQYMYKDSGQSSSGIHVRVEENDWRNGFAFKGDLALNGSRSLRFAPAGQTSAIKLTSDWPHPGFSGAFLPDNRTISEAGFDADWSVPFLARGLPNVIEADSLPLGSQMLGVEFIEPVNFYQTISRSLKYAIGFIGLTFMAVFLLEVRSGWSMHWIQYGLVGMALIVFFVMLLAIAEHVGYTLAYLLAAAAATTLIASYVGSTLRSWMSALIMMLVIGAVYGTLFAIMREQDYALLIGSVIAFLALAVTMFGTNRINWSGAQAKQGA